MYNFVEHGGVINGQEEDQEKYAAFMEKIDSGKKIEADDWMPKDYRETLIKLISMHGISEIMGALPEKEWVPKAPTLYRKLGIMAKVQDEMGHGQLLLRVAEDLLAPYGKGREDLMIDLLNGDLKFHNVFHMETKTWADAGVIGWLVDGAAIISQTNMLDASYGPYQRALQRICAEEVFHAQHGEAIIMALAEGTETQRQMLQEALNRWWPALLMFFGPESAETTGSSKQEVTTKYKIRKNSNEELRQAFLDKYLPRVFSLGLTVPDETLYYNEDEKRWVYQQPNWNEFKQIIRNNGPRSKERLRLRKLAHEKNKWVREALAAQPVTN
ncbi:1,2-phenylacetyl-CoA epoxidase subunit PaaA [Halalkalibacterium halodurans]|jgi:ring-1,2-phenylacetyl-CoA epoxidase subunit PaaA|uniref:Ring-oxidation complex protein 1 in the phenylacetic acid catabolism pathway n=2 Tax=Halalkalibacterium halodurans TaxID=86665 RepID=Q7AK13_HALH5|nr:1,2-phenylacetyl-CoA epoxidase subunit PaaA [Halalkalibacterium halodurans]MDY7220704.1 1,2-phenylacetyl-CoA epoxidase subunit PaaA [Halalkalibacterium halodurans]MDY7239943.1 1,2-phenylacetyl-CoA epoxidase subunit PaaA [Halalkalibacterium halodurans]MED4125879.1 1,2-phenylacetyl-CoA epoxidase subunit A [Halalkalibacterium halodurans]MED4171695.1 1,2-phenylacetyl-CoA epoxidase subunit A [Halalkalibacterium halodurans]TPE68382.1 1,2-phenylacetyl-CoA epoxidase subunit A [Halalkalibacterium ha